MRLNKNVASKFKWRYDWVLEDLRTNLMVIAAISVAFNTLSSPVLGIKALLIFVVAWYASRLTEAMYYMFAKNMEYKEAMVKVKESFPEVSGLIFALLIPIGTPLYGVIVSLALAIVIAKIAFGGYSYNIFNVGVVAALICYVSWPDSVVQTLNSGYWLDYLLLQLSNVLQAPLGGILALPQTVTVNTVANAAEVYPTWSLFTNNVEAFLGLIPTVILIPIGIRLIFNEIIDYRIPLMISSMTVIGGFLVAFLMRDIGFFPAIWYGLNGLLGTIMIFVAFFVASDPVTSPNSTNTQFIYSMIIVIVTLFIREVSGNIEGVLYAILFANMLVPLLNAKSGMYELKRKRVLLGVASFIFLLSMIFIGYNRNEEPLAYKEYYHASISSDKLDCTPSSGETATDGEASASTETEEPAPAEETDGDASASTETEAPAEPATTSVCPGTGAADENTETTDGATSATTE